MSPFAHLSAGWLTLLHFLFEDLGLIIGFRYFLYLRKQSNDSISSSDRIWILAGGGVGALLFSRLLGDLENPPLLMQNITSFSYYYTNKTIVGGLLGGLLLTEITKKILKVKASSGDMITFPIILAVLTGRIGCFIAGLKDFSYGNPTRLPWGIDFGDGIRRHPIALYEMSFLLLTWIVLFQLKKRYILKDGFLFKLFMVAYLSFRFLADFIKPVWFSVIGLSTIQLACLAGLIYYYKVFITSPLTEELPQLLPESLKETD